MFVIPTPLLFSVLVAGMKPLILSLSRSLMTISCLISKCFNYIMDKFCSAISFPFFWTCPKDSTCFDTFQFCSTEGVAGLCCLKADTAIRETDFQSELQVTKSVCEDVDTVRGSNRIF